MSEINYAEVTALIIEDDSSLNYLLEKYLQKIGFQKIFKAYDGQEALIKLRLGETKPDIILCDLEMPVMDGFEFLKILRSDQGLEFKKTPVLILTGHKEEEEISKIIPLGIHGYLVKPVMLNDLIKRVSFALSSPMIDPAGIGG